MVVEIPLQPVADYSKVPTTDNNEDEDNTNFNNNDNIPSSPQVALIAAVNNNDNDNEEEEEDKQQLLSEEEAQKERKEKEQGLPWRTLLSIYFIVWTESAVMNGFNPIIPGMCRDRFGMSEDLISIASGFLVGGYIFATFLSSFFLGHLSDIFGRQKFMLLGSGVGALCSVGFGLAPWYWLAFLLRFFAGLCNANTALTRAVISDIVPRGPQRAQAYGYHGATVSFARAFSSALSGLTSEVILDKHNPLLDDRYFLPAMFAAVMQLAAFILNIVFVPESNMAPAAAGTGKKESRSLTAGVKEIKNDRLVQKLILSNCLSSFGNGGMLLGIVLYFSLEIKDNGLGLSAFYNGILFGWFGLAGVIFQFIFFKYLLKKKDILWLFQFGNATLALGCLLLPATSIFYAAGGITTTMKVFSWIYVILVCCVMAAGFMTCLPVITTMINNCANPDRQGLISGTSQSLSSFLRAFGPSLCGIIFAGAVAIKAPVLLFIFLVCVYSSSFCLLKFGLSPSEKLKIIERDRGH